MRRQKFFARGDGDYMQPFGGEGGFKCKFEAGNESKNPEDTSSNESLIVSYNVYPFYKFIHYAKIS